MAQPRLQEAGICTERHARVIEAFIALANAVIITRRLIRIAWTTHRWDTRPRDDPDLSARSLRLARYGLHPAEFSGLLPPGGYFRSAALAVNASHGLSDHR